MQILIPCPSNIERSASMHWINLQEQTHGNWDLVVGGLQGKAAVKSVQDAMTTLAMMSRYQPLAVKKGKKIARKAAKRGQNKVRKHVGGKVLEICQGKEYEKRQTQLQ